MRALLILVASTAAAVDTLPVAKPANGTCAFDWTSSGSHCPRSGSR
jgi:hypothetical protein